MLRKYCFNPTSENVPGSIFCWTFYASNKQMTSKAELWPRRPWVPHPCTRQKRHRTSSSQAWNHLMKTLRSGAHVHFGQQPIVFVVVWGENTLIVVWNELNGDGEKLLIGCGVEQTHTIGMNVGFMGTWVFVSFHLCPSRVVSYVNATSLYAGARG